MNASRKLNRKSDKQKRYTLTGCKRLWLVEDEGKKKRKRKEKFAERVRRIRANPRTSPAIFIPPSAQIPGVTSGPERAVPIRSHLYMSSLLISVGSRLYPGWIQAGKPRISLFRGPDSYRGELRDARAMSARQVQDQELPDFDELKVAAV